MKETDKKRTPNNSQSKRSAKTERHQNLNGKETESKASLHSNKSIANVLASDANTGSEPSVAYENMVMHYVDDVNRSEEVSQVPKASSLIMNGNSNDLDKEDEQIKEEESDSETSKDSVSRDSSSTAEGDKVEKMSTTTKDGADKNSQVLTRGSRLRSDTEASKSRTKSVNNNTPKKPSKPSKGPSRDQSKALNKMVKDLKVPNKVSSGSSDGADDKPSEETKEMDAFDETSNGTQSVASESVASDNETVDAEENGEHENEEALNQKIESMEIRIEKLEEELREVAALEISLYSVVPEHGSSAHKVHTPARRLSRLYIHGCKHWSQDKRATIAKNTVSGLVLIAKSCGSDVPRLTFWLSNTIVLREIIFQAFGSSRNSSPIVKVGQSNGINNRSDAKSTSLKWKGSTGSKHLNGFMQFIDDWQETGTFTSAIEKIESWIFSRIVESVWWQALTPHMQSTSGDKSNKSKGRLLGPALGDQQQGSFSINLWKSAFQDAFQRLCPVRAGGHECGCLPVIARIVMEQCVARLDVAMFNAILRESAHQIPTDPVSDPIVDSKVLPIPAGDLSFGSGAQLKNSIGNWSRWLTDMFGMDADDTSKEDQQSDEEDNRQGGLPKSFSLLNDLSDLLMLPKDMLMDQSIRKEVCPSVSLSLVKRILCNFTPDEFCTDAVPGAVLEALNAESVVEQRSSGGDIAQNFPYIATPVVYTAPSSADVAEKVAEAGERSQLSRNVSTVQRKGYTSDDELEELDSPLTSLIGSCLPSSPTIPENGKHKEVVGCTITNTRYQLLREVWSGES